MADEIRKDVSPETAVHHIVYAAGTIMKEVAFLPGIQPEKRDHIVKEAQLIIKQVKVLERETKYLQKHFESPKRKVRRRRKN